MAWWFRAAIAILLSAAGIAAAHPVVSAIAVVQVDRQGRLTLSLQHDALAFALNDLPANIADGPMYELLDGPEPELARAMADANERFATLFKLAIDGAGGAVTIDEFPTSAAARAWRAAHQGRQLPWKAEIIARADLPRGARTFTVRFPEVLGDVILTVDRWGAEPLTFPLRPAETSPAFDVSGLTGARDPTTSRPADQLGAWGIAWRYLKLGIVHIIPQGPDHALFVLGLFLLTPRVKTLLWQITAFTVAHSITLTLASLHLVSIPRGLVEPTIAATIAFVAIENLLTTRVHAWRPLVAFLFGLVHGLGFASDLIQVGLPTGQLAAALIAFNVGVECAHIAVLAGAFALLGWCRARRWYRRRVAIPLSLLIAAVACFWIVQRL
jgi:hypothetical protein